MQFRVLKREKRWAAMWDRPSIQPVPSGFEQDRLSVCQKGKNEANPSAPMRPSKPDLSRRLEILAATSDKRQNPPLNDGGCGAGRHPTKDRSQRGFEVAPSDVVGHQLAQQAKAGRHRAGRWNKIYLLTPCPFP